MSVSYTHLDVYKRQVRVNSDFLEIYKLQSFVKIIQAVLTLKLQLDFLVMRVKPDYFKFLNVSVIKLYRRHGQFEFVIFHSYGQFRFSLAFIFCKIKNLTIFIKLYRLYWHLKFITVVSCIMESPGFLYLNVCI